MVELAIAQQAKRRQPHSRSTCGNQSANVQAHDGPRADEQIQHDHAGNPLDQSRQSDDLERDDASAARSGDADENQARKSPPFTGCYSTTQ